LEINAALSFLDRFKLHLRSKGVEGPTDNVPPLPPNKTVVEVFADFLQYLLTCSETFINQNYANGPDLWASVKDTIDFVLSHPNGWEGREQSQMRRAALLSGLVPDTMAGHSRITFVTEGEASLHFTIEKGILSGVNMKVSPSVLASRSNTLMTRCRGKVS